MTAAQTSALVRREGRHDPAAHDPDAIIAELVSTARRLAKTAWPSGMYARFDFDAAIWDVHRTHDDAGLPIRGPATRRTLRFLKHGSEIECLPPAFANATKAWVVLDDLGFSAMRTGVNAVRRLWRAIEPTCASAAFDWRTVSRSHFESAEAAMHRDGSKPGTIALVSYSLRSFARWLEHNAICRGIDYTPSMAVPGHRELRTPEGQRIRQDRLPTRAAIEGLASIYTTYAVQPSDRLLICAMGVLLLTGFRIGELLTLPAACEVREPWRGRERFGLRFWKEKSRGRYRFAVRWLSPLGAELARSLLAEIRTLTAAARAQARCIEESGGRVVLPDPDCFPGEVDSRAVARALGLKLQSLGTLCRKNVIPLRPTRRSPVGTGALNLFARAEVEAYLTGKRGTQSAFVPGSSAPQLLSETLLLARRGFFQPVRRQTPSTLLVDALEEHLFQQFLAGASSPGSATPQPPGRQEVGRSAFARFGIREPFTADGSGGEISRMRSHMARHWLNTIANRAGMSAFQITLWMGRRSEAQTAPYLHPELYAHSAPDHATLVREGYANGTVAGYRKSIYDALSDEQRRVFSESTEAAHKLRSGVCVISHLEDCPFTKACWADCPYVLRTVGHAGERAELTDLRVNVARGLERYAALVASGRRLQPRQEQLCRQILAGIDRALAVDPPVTGDGR